MTLRPFPLDGALLTLDRDQGTHVLLDGDETAALNSPGAHVLGPHGVGVAVRERHAAISAAFVSSPQSVAVRERHAAISAATFVS